VSLLPSADAESKLFLAIIEDITERKHTELKLRHSKESAEAGSRAKSEFLATMSHELRTPLNAIMGLSQLLLQNIVGELNDKQKEYVTCIYTSGEHLLALINDILDISKIEAGHVTLNHSEFDLYRLLDELQQMFSSIVAKKELTLNVVRSHNLPQIICSDRLKLRQILINLLSNAVKFTATGS
ncbi:MAG: histidine kinase dimerization/phospho-acceptor domain-containing protein, partial [Cyanobacteria bacterium J06639_18]